MIDTTDSHVPPSERVHDTVRILRALRQAVQEAVLDHKRTGDPVAVCREGRVVWVQPEDIPALDTEATESKA